MTWLDIGNGWRNIYLLSCVIQAAALGSLFCARGWFAKKSRAACFFTGAASTPLVQYLWTLLLALVFPGASKWIYIGVPPLLAALCLAVLALRRARRLKELIARAGAFTKRALHFDKPALISLCFAACIGILLLPVCVRFSTSMSSMLGGDAGEYMALAQRYCEDRDFGELAEKEETEGHFRGHSHFPSLELYMSYGLFHTGGEEYGYPYDKAAFAGDGLLTFYMVAAYLALLLALCRERKRWVLLGALLLNLVPGLVDSVGYAPRDIWRILALLIAMLYFAGLSPCGNARSYIGKLAACLVVCFTVMSTHVVCFVVLPFIVVAWVVWRWLESLLLGDRHAGRTLIRSVGLALSGAAGTLVAFIGNIWCYARWGELSPWRLMTTFTDAPWYSMYMDMDYRLEITTRHLDFWQARNDIMMGYATPIGVWGLRLALIALVCTLILLIYRRARLKRRERELIAAMPKDGASSAFVKGKADERADIASVALYSALIVILTLAPMTGVLDTPFYSFSGSFLKLQRYTLQWFAAAAVMCCCALAALESLWPSICAFLQAKTGKLTTRIRALKCAPTLGRLVRTLPAWLCALLCVMSFAKGVSQTGYSNSFYRYSRDVMEDEGILLDTDFRKQYATLMSVAEHVADDERILVTRVGYQYALKGRGYVLTSNPIAPLMNLPLGEVGAALRELNVVAVASEPDFWDKRYYALSTLSEYLNALPPEQIIEGEKMRLYILKPSLAEFARDD